MTDKSAAHDTVRVEVNDGTIIGRRLAASAEYPRAVDAFYGVPYASVERFRRAAAKSPPQGGRVMMADRPGPRQPCPMAMGEVSERELRLTILRPSKQQDGKGKMSTTEEEQDKAPLLPVVVYVHGGAFNFGEPMERDLRAFVAWTPLAAGVLVVAIEYRLGALGFLHVPGPDDGGPPMVEANLGLRDQRVALEWIRDWIGAFGGRVDDVTLMGVSAGAHAIGHQILCPEQPPLPIVKAILESGSPTARSVLAASHPRPAEQLASLRSHAGGRDLSALPLAELLDAAVLVWAEGMASVCWPFQPVVDGPAPGGMIPRTPLELWRELVPPLDDGQPGRASSQRQRQRRGRAVLPRAVITGFCSHEGTQFVPQRAATNDDFLAFFRTLIPGLSPTDLAALEELYPDPTTDSSPSSSSLRNLPHDVDAGRGAQFRRLHEAYAHYAYIAPVLHTAHLLSNARLDGDNHVDDDGGPSGCRVYVYEYAALAEPFNAASHGDHAPVVARDPVHLRRRPGLAAVGAEMGRRWAAFAADPEGKLEPDVWPAFVSPFNHRNDDYNDDSRQDENIGAEEQGEAEGEGTGEGVGQLLVFGEGNDEAANGHGRGVPVRTRTLTAREMRQCRFWWALMPLSQGHTDGAAERIHVGT